MITPLLIFVLTAHGIALLSILSAGLIAYRNSPEKPINSAFFIMAVFIALYEAEYILTPLMPTATAAYWVGFVSVILFFLAAAFVSFLLIVADRAKQFRWYTQSVYAAATVLTAISFWQPSLYIVGVEPRLYFPWWLIPGPLFLVMSILVLVAPLFPFFLAMRRRAELEGVERRRIEYFTLFFAIALPLGSFNLLLTYGFGFGPFISAFTGLSMIPIAYGIVADELLDIRVVLRRALLYSFSIGTITGFLTLLIFLNDYLVERLPWVQFWTVPIFVAFISFLIGRFIWLKFAESERIKYEFITVATHKLRTPLTQINWGLRELIENTKNRETRDHALRVQQSTNRLIELTNIIFETTQEDSKQYNYSKEKVGLVATTKDVFEKLSPIISDKKLDTSIHVDTEVYVMADARRIRSVIEVFIENAVNYTPEGGFVQVIVYEKGDSVIYSVRDSGIGVSPAERKNIFTRFYRTDAAKRADTEGVGLGLAMAKNIIERHQGKVGVESPGEDKGATFWFSLPKN